MRSVFAGVVAVMLGAVSAAGASGCGDVASIDHPTDAGDAAETTDGRDAQGDDADGRDAREAAVDARETEPDAEDADDDTGSTATDADAEASLDAGPPPYVVEVVRVTSPQCDDLSTATTLTTNPTTDPDVVDDRATSLIPLPFPFAYFGTPATHYSVATNGFAQVWPSSPATPSASGLNEPLPTWRAPKTMIAAFWDDLYLNPTSAIRAATLGAEGARRLVVEWHDWRINVAGTEDPVLTFQAKLFEGTNVVEVHWCSIAPGSRADLATGGGATIGLQDRTGTSGVQHASDTPDAASTTKFLRFVPVAPH